MKGLNTFVGISYRRTFGIINSLRRGPAHTIVNYMKLPKDQLEPIMTNSENIIHFGPNAYTKPATGLNIFWRETIMGRETFFEKLKKHILKMGVRRHPTGFLYRFIQNDGRCFWWRFRLVLRGWFYSTDAVDIAIDKVTVATPDFDGKPQARDFKYKVDEPEVNDFEDISKIRNKTIRKLLSKLDGDQSFLRDFLLEICKRF